MKKYAIVNKKTREFYADPIYTDKQKALEKIQYLMDYRARHEMETVEYELEELTKEREEEHNREWQRFVSMID